MPAIKRKVLYCLPVDQLTDGDCGCLDVLRVGGHVHYLGHLADLELEVLHDYPADFKCQICDGLGAETLRLDFDTICARRQRGYLIIAVAVGLCDALKPGGLVAHGDLRAGDEGAGRVCDGALNSGGLLDKRNGWKSPADQALEGKVCSSSIFFSFLLEKAFDNF